MENSYRDNRVEFVLEGIRIIFIIYKTNTLAKWINQKAPVTPFVRYNMKTGEKQIAEFLEIKRTKN